MPAAIGQQRLRTANTRWLSPRAGIAGLSQRLSRRASLTTKCLQIGYFSCKCENLPKPRALVRPGSGLTCRSWVLIESEATRAV